MPYSVFCVPPSDLHYRWPLVQPELERLRKRFPAEWIPEDIYADIRSSTSYLYMVMDGNGEINGFYVLQPRGHELLLYVVAMLRSAPRDKRHVTMLEGIHAIRQAAVNGKFKKVVAYSQRPGATRYFQRFGFMPTEVKFEMEI